MHPATSDRPRTSARRYLCAGRILVACALTIVALASMPGSAGAHTELREASPGEGQRVGGRVEVVQLAFFDRVGPDVEIVLAGPDGALVEPAGPAEVDGAIVQRSFERLSLVGEYVVQFRAVASDGFPTEGNYAFFFDPNSPRQLPVLGGRPLPAERSSGGIARILGLASMGFFALAVLLFVFGPRRGSKTSSRSASKRSASKRSASKRSASKAGASGKAASSRRQSDR